MAWTILLYLAYCGASVFMAIWEKSIVDDRKRHGNTKQINHALFSLIWMAVVAPLWFRHHDWFLIGSVTLLHFHLFGGVYQIINGNNFFLLSKTSTAISERFFVWIGFKSYTKPYLLSCILSIYLLIKSIYG